VPASWLMLQLYCHKLLVTFENYGSLSLCKLCLPVGACTLEWVYPINRLFHAGPRITVHASKMLPQLRFILELWWSGTTALPGELNTGEAVQSMPQWKSALAHLI